MPSIPICLTNRENHHGICTTLEVSTQNYFLEDTAEHSGYELCYTLEGSLHHRRFRNKNWLLTPNDLMIFNAREAHTEECSKNPSVRRLRTLIIDDEFIQGLFSDIGIRGSELLFTNSLIKPSSRMWELLNILFSFKKTPQASRFIFDCLVTELTLELVTQNEHSCSNKIQQFLKTGHFPSQLLKAKTIMRELACASDVSLDSVAQLSGLSKFHFVRSFKENVGMSPIQYLNCLKIDYVKKRLANTKELVTDVAMDLGFSDLSTFNKSFKKITGLSPTQYRQQLSH